MSGNVWQNLTIARYRETTKSKIERRLAVLADFRALRSPWK